MLTRIDVNGDNAFYVPIYGVTPKDSIIVQSITGLDSPDVDLFIGDFSRDGGSYTGRRVGQRNVVITFELNPNPALGETVSGLREILYRAFLEPVDGEYVKLGLTLDDGRELYCIGYTEKTETDIFSDETLMQVSLLCPDPYIYSNTEKTYSSDAGYTILPFSYEGTAKAGFYAKVKVTSATSVLNLKIGTKIMSLTKAFGAGEIVEFTTSRGSRAINSTAGGTTVPIVYALGVTSPWIELRSISNQVKVYGATESALVAGLQSFKFRPAYWGI